MGKKKGNKGARRPAENIIPHIPASPEAVVKAIMKAPPLASVGDEAWPYMREGK